MLKIARRIWIWVEAADTGNFAANSILGALAVGSPIYVFWAFIDVAGWPLSLLIALPAAAVTLLGIALLASLIGWFHVRFSPTKNEDGRLFIDDFNSRVDERKAFWRHAVARYGDWKSSRDAPRTLSDLVREVEIPKVQGARIDLWAMRHRNGWGETSRTLLDFAQSFYPDDADGPADPELDGMRTSQAKFWDRWAYRTKHRDRFTYREIVRAAESNLRDLKLLLYLQMAEDIQKQKKVTALKRDFYDLCYRIAKDG